MPCFFLFLANAAGKGVSFHLGLDKGLSVCYSIDNDPDSKPFGCLKGANMGFTAEDFRG